MEIFSNNPLKPSLLPWGAELGILSEAKSLFREALIRPFLRLKLESNGEMQIPFCIRYGLFCLVEIKISRVGFLLPRTRKQ